MPYWRLFYHVVWATRHREPVIDEGAARIVTWSIQTTCRKEDAVLHAIGIMPDHVHVAVSIPPKVSISTFVGRLKGAATHTANQESPVSSADPLAWQAEYGVLSFGEKQLPVVLDYIANQRERHATNQLWSSLERFTDESQSA